MKHVRKYIILIFVATVMMLLYVHQQIAIIQYSYCINEKEDYLAELTETHKNFKYRLAALKSPSVLEQRLAAADINLVLPNKVNIVTAPLEQSVPLNTAEHSSPTQQFRLFQWWKFERTAQAGVSK